jgi:hypothetical protein
MPQEVQELPFKTDLPEFDGIAYSLVQERPPVFYQIPVTRESVSHLAQLLGGRVVINGTTLDKPSLEYPDDHVHFIDNCTDREHIFDADLGDVLIVGLKEIPRWGKQYRVYEKFTEQEFQDREAYNKEWMAAIHETI